MSFVPQSTFASPQVVIIRCFKCSLTLLCAFVATELVISASMINLCSGGFSLLLIEGSVCSYHCGNNAHGTQRSRALKQGSHNIRPGPH